MVMNKAQYQKRERKGQHNRPQKHSGKSPHKVSGLILFGRHPVVAGLGNPSREKIALYATEKALAALRDEIELAKELPIHLSTGHEIADLVGEDAPHQGLALRVRPLPGQHLSNFAPIASTAAGAKNIIVVLDQVSDPHNVGAIMRSAAAFGARAVITTERNSPSESGVLAKSASGALETVPWIRVTNLSRALEELADLGYWRVGLDGNAKHAIGETDAGENVALVLGAEGKGLREGTAKKCDYLVRLPISNAVESLNVSNAAAVALYEFAKA